MKGCATKKDGDKLVAEISCEIDHHTAKEIRQIIDEKLVNKEFKILILDFSRVSFMDSSGIGLILGRAAKAEEVGATVEVVGLSSGLRRLVRMSGMERIPNIRVK